LRSHRPLERGLEGWLGDQNLNIRALAPVRSANDEGDEANQAPAVTMSAG
jgi:hypothetical protein